MDVVFDGQNGKLPGPGVTLVHSHIAAVGEATREL